MSAPTVHHDRASLVPQPVRVLLTGPDLATFRGGIQTFVASIQKAFLSVDEVQLRFLPVTLGLYNDEGWAPKIFRNLRSLPRFVQLLNDCAVVHLNSSFDNRSVTRDLVFLALAALRRRRIILMFHGGNPEFVWWFRQPLARAFSGRLLGRCQAVLALSQVQIEGLRRALPRLRCTRQVANFIDVGAPAIRPIVPGSPVHFLYIGRLHVDKGLREIIAAVQVLIRSNRPIKLTICGDGPAREWLSKEIETYHLQDTVELAGVVRGAAKDAAFAAADILLLPSYREGFPFVILEAFSAGIPVISTPVGAIPEVVRNEENGLIVAAGDHAALARAMHQMIADPTARLQMGRNARSLVESKYSHETMRQVFSELYGARHTHLSATPGTDGR